jgi:biotin carboxyl carrier protein
MDGNRQSYKETLSSEEQFTPDDISIKQLQRLVHLLDRSDVSEIEVKRVSLGIRLVLRKAKATDNSDLQIVVPSVAHTETAPPVEAKYTVAAPLVGIFHAWAKPGGKPLVMVGDCVKVGQRVGMIQSLNVFNEVETPVAGRIVELLVQEGQPVEYGQPLITIDGAEEV